MIGLATCLICRFCVIAEPLYGNRGQKINGYRLRNPDKGERRRIAWNGFTVQFDAREEDRGCLDHRCF